MYRMIILIIIKLVYVKYTDDYWGDSFDENQNCKRDDEVIYYILGFYYYILYFLSLVLIYTICYFILIGNRHVNKMYEFIHSRYGYGLRINTNSHSQRETFDL